MKRTLQSTARSIALLLLLCILASAFISCVDTTPKDDQDHNGASDTGNDQAQGEFIDYVGQLKLDFSSDTKKQEATVLHYVDGDTTHFNVPTSVMESGVLKARYLAINTPESTGTIEKWGKAASNFTRSKLENAQSIILESDDDQWNVDSTSSHRCLVWVWYRQSADADYRNLNLEILQYGYAIASNSAGNRYGETCMAAINQARANKLVVYSNDKDDLFYEGAVKEVTLKAIRTNPEQYVGVNVSFEAVITREYSNTLYVEDYDTEDGIYYGFTVYYGYSVDPTLASFLKLGNRVKFVGSVQYYETGGTYQLSGLKYNIRKPQESCQLVSTDAETEYVLTSPATFAKGKLTIPVSELDDEGETIEVERTYSYAELVMSTTIAMTDLKVTRVYTTTSEASSSQGAMTLTCRAQDGTTVDIRTVVLLDEEENLITADAYEGKTIDVCGVVDYFSGSYQIKVFSYKDITVKD